MRTLDLLGQSYAMLILIFNHNSGTKNNTKTLIASIQQALKCYFVDLVCVCLWLKKPTYFTIQLIFTTIHGSITIFGTIHGFHCTILTNFYFYL